MESKRNKYLYNASIVLFAVVSLELLTRSIVGYPPLFMTHPTIEYQMVPNQDVVRFDNRQLYNELGMRSEPLDDRNRVLVMGDSVLNGGVHTDHAELATTILSDDKTQYLNVSAGSWGPPNLLAWIQEHGTHEAESIIFVFNTMDFYDIPTFAPLAPTHPHKERGAVMGLFYRYVLINLPWYKQAHTDANRRSARPELESLFSLDLPACVILHPTQGEMASNQSQHMKDARAQFLALIDKHYISHYDLKGVYEDLPDFTSIYDDVIHLNAKGQELLAESILESEC